MIIGLVSDTHGLFDPRLREILRGSELILHAGDVGSEDVLAELRRIAPVQAVRGNVDAPNWPLSLTVSPAGLTIHMLHILPAAQSDLQEWADLAKTSSQLPRTHERLIKAFDPSVRVVVFGHSHQPCLIEFGGVIWVNPGSAGCKRFSLPRTCALLEVFHDMAEARIVPLEPAAEALPKALRFRFARTA